MIDDVTGTVWSHLDGSAVAGDLEGSQLEIRALQTTTWASWLAEHPETTVPAVDTGYGYFRSTIGRAGLSRTFLQTLPALDDRLADNTLVIGVLAGDEARAFPVRSVPATTPLQDTVGGVPVVILEDVGGIPSVAYHRLLTDGRVLDFERRYGAIFDGQTGSRWNSMGLAVEGELAGVQLAFVTSFFTEWYGWAAFHPETSIYELPGGA
jgi:hypothetical protein